MYTLLIVDDEIFEAEGIKSTVDFGKLGIECILEAYNIRQAREIFESRPVDILLCNIEMPQGNGLELLEWVRRNHTKTECIFLTCHADFKYAHKAIQLGSLDYLLKPAQAPELETVLLKAIEKIQKESEVVEYRRFSKLWLKHQPLLLERFWLDIINQRILSSHQEIKKAAVDINFPGLEEIRTLPILIRAQRWVEKMDMRDEKLMEFALKNIAQELILKAQENGIIVELGEGALLAILYLEGFESIDFESLKKEIEGYISKCHDLLKCDLCCYIGMGIFCFELADAVKQLFTLDKNNVKHKNRVFFLNRKLEVLTDLSLPDMSAWLAMLDRCESKKVLDEITKYIEKLSDETDLNAYAMHQLQHYFMNLIFTFTKGKGLELHKLFSDDQSVEYFEQATRSVNGMIQWISHSINKSVDYVIEIEKSRTNIGKVISYIDQNIDKELSCEDIANHVFLNPIYLTRIFKKETGLSLSEYLLQQRLKLARDLLSKTNMPVSAVAAHVGYSNFSHFSRMFRKYTGLSPVDFRRRLLETERK